MHGAKKRRRGLSGRLLVFDLQHDIGPAPGGYRCGPFGGLAESRGSQPKLSIEEHENSDERRGP